MSLKNKINKRLTESSTWILNSPESLVILMLMGSGIAFLFFGVFSVALGFAKIWFLVVLFGIFSLLALKKFINVMKMVKQLGLKNALGGFSANEFVWHKGGKENEYEKHSKGINTQCSGTDKENAREQRQDNRQSKSTDIRFGEYIQLNDGDSKET